MKNYLDLLKNVLSNGTMREDRTKVGVKSIFGYQMRFNLNDGFPVVTTKKLHLCSIIGELLWFLRGDTNIKWLNEHNITIWNEWADSNGDLGEVYGYQWRSWLTADGKYIDQITNIINQIKTNPTSRRLIVNSWNVGSLDKMALPPCHCFFQFYVNQGRLSCQLYQRSADIFLGVPFNIASYSLLLMMVANVTGLEPYEFIHTLGDAHIYSNHLEQAQLQITREPFALPRMEINSDIKDIFSFDFSDFNLVDYKAHPHIKAKVAV